MTTTDDTPDADLPDAATPRTPTPPPIGLGSPGGALWADVTGKYLLRHDELRVLEHAARTMDDLDRLQTALAAQPVMVKGAAGQDRPNPLFTEIRGTRAVLARLFTQLGLPEDGEAVVGEDKVRSNMARKAAHARWGRSTG